MVSFDTFSNVVDGKLKSTASTRHGINPATLEELAPVPVSTQEDLDVAVAAAAKAQVEWAKVPIEKRREAVGRFADALEKKSEDFSAFLTREQGKPVRKETVPSAHVRFRVRVEANLSVLPHSWPVPSMSCSRPSAC